jgi:hypothetical protein
VFSADVLDICWTWSGDNFALLSHTKMLVQQKYLPLPSACYKPIPTFTNLTSSSHHLLGLHTSVWHLGFYTYSNVDSLTCCFQFNCLIFTSTIFSIAVGLFPCVRTCKFFGSLLSCLHVVGARGSVAGWCTMLQAGRSRVRFPMRSLDFLIDLIFQAALSPWVRLSL